MKIIYIMGAGHIGSTILDIAISNHLCLESLGEISKFHRFGWMPDDNRKCACGLSVFECPFWMQVRKIWADLMAYDDAERYINLQEQIEGSRYGWVRLLWNNFRLTSDFTEYMRGTEALYRAVQQVSGSPFLVDSSLSPRRAYGLTLNPRIDLYLIHLVRDGRGIIWSLKKPGKKTLTKVYKPAPSWRTSRYWITANLQSAWVFNHVKEDKRQMIRYEDFVTSPSTILDKIGTLVGEDLSGLVTGSTLVHPNQDRHTVGGNRIRMQKDIRIRPDFAWLEHLPEKDRKLYWGMAGWLARQYGYKKHQTDYGI
ncbi:MAG: hypothetical protein JSV68_16210 [Anaerolineaceae bacterium]|nr:MAG: hypothetical protein JSV68_16210 [Anaerolineaceae bacterium]